MTINEIIKNYLDNNFDSRLMLDINNNFTIYKDNDEILPVLVDQFVLWAAENEDEQCRDNPIYLLIIVVNIMISALFVHSIMKM